MSGLPDGRVRRKTRVSIHNPAELTAALTAPSDGQRVSFAAPFGKWSVSNGAQGFFTSRDGRLDAVCLIGAGTPHGRSNNEDAALVHQDSGSRLVRIVVADGMGGATAGEVASHSVIRAAETAFDSHYSLKALPGFIRTELSAARPFGVGTMGAAWLALEIDEASGRVSTLHQGDVRMVVIAKDGAIAKLTSEHTWAEYLVRSRVCSHDTVPPHMHDTLYSFAGYQEGEPNMEEPEHAAFSVYGGDFIVIASDGLFDLVPPEEVASLRSEEETPTSFLALLKDLAKERALAGGKDDNIVVVVYAPAVAKERPLSQGALEVKDNGGSLTRFFASLVSTGRRMLNREN